MCRLPLARLISVQSSRGEGRADVASKCRLASLCLRSETCKAAKQGAGELRPTAVVPEGRARIRSNASGTSSNSPFLVVGSLLVRFLHSSLPRTIYGPAPMVAGGLSWYFFHNALEYPFKWRSLLLSVVSDFSYSPGSPFQARRTRRD